MAPVRSSAARRGATQPQAAVEQAPLQPAPVDDVNDNTDLFVDPMLGTPLSAYIEKDVENRDDLVQLWTTYGGTISSGYSAVTYILVDPHKHSGQNLFRLYIGKKGKVVLNARWIRECVRTSELQTFKTKFAGCLVTGKEEIYTGPAPRMEEDPPNLPQVIAQEQVQVQQPQQQLREPEPQQQPQASTSSQVQVSAQVPAPVPAPIPPQPVSLPFPMPTVAAVMAVDPLGFSHSVYGQPMPGPHGMGHPATHPWPPMPHMIRPTHDQPYREDQAWADYNQHPSNLGASQGAYGGEYRYRESNPPWLPSSSNAGYYDPTGYDQTFGQQPYLPDPAPADIPPPEEDPGLAAGLGDPMDVAPTTGTLEPPERARGRKRTRMQPMPATPAESLVNRTAPAAARSPTPPSRVIKSTYGGNLFTADDVLYLKKYIDYVQGQGLVLSLREICERIAVKAPHHTFFSWRRYCNKHQIRLGGYVMTAARGGTPPMDDDAGGMDIEEEPGADNVRRGPCLSLSSINTAAVRAATSAPRNRSPTPPRALYRSTTGKGVAFTQEDVDFLMKFLRFRESQGRVDSVQFWKDVATKAPHHSRASWMKYWRRHKHELMAGGDEETAIPVPEKKVRYSQGDDVLLARFFQEKREGTSDKLFQSFSRLHPHHPWKGWQEHFRIHKAKIDHLIEILESGQELDDEGQIVTAAS